MRASTARGFSLIEVVVALVIMTLSLTALLRQFSNSLGLSNAAGDLAVATALAQSLLAQTGIAERLQLGETAGVTFGDYQWRRAVREFEEAEADSWRQMIGSSVRISLTVWNDRKKVPPVTLTTLRIMPPFAEWGLQR